MRLIADDLFAGAGGWDLAAAQLGIHARGVENMPAARATREAAGLTTIHDDVWTFRPKYVARNGGLVPVATGLIASPPCQTFSAAGKGAGRKALGDVLALIPRVPSMTLAELRTAGEAFGDDRTALVLTPLWFAMHHGYEWLAWEQVPTVLPVWEACAHVLREAGWHVWTGVLHAEQYGVPQTRKRAFLLASLRGPVTPPAPTHSRYHSRSPERIDEGMPRWVSMAEALGWQVAERSTWAMRSNAQVNAAVRPVDHPAETITGGHDHNDRRWVLRNNSTANAAERTPDQPAPTLYFGQRSNYCAWEWRGEGSAPDLPEWAFNRPSTTIVGSFKPEVVAAPGYRTTVSRQNAPDSVRVTVQEAGVLQSFPADFPWQGAKGKQFLQCGNAVPPMLALHALAAAVHIDLATVEVAA